MPNDTQADLTAWLADLERERDELVASLPAHSTPAVMLIRLEDLEDAIAAVRQQLETGSRANPDS